MPVYRRVRSDANCDMPTWTATLGEGRNRSETGRGRNSSALPVPLEYERPQCNNVNVHNAFAVKNSINCERRWVAPYAVNLFGLNSKEVSMRIGVLVILSIVTRKERPGSNPKGFGHVAS